jgi:LDH2 family malate/lactate/ureidoglycolate dehydrogenase
VLTPNIDRGIAANAMRAFTADALRACGVPEADAAIAAGAMIEADVTGADAHGIFRLTNYVAQLRRGQVNPTPNVRVIERGPAVALIDGDNGIGHLVMTRAANLAVELARVSGIGWVGTRHSNHAGAAGIYAAIPLAHDMIGIYGAVSGANFMAPWGGAEPLLGTNPIAIAVPSAGAAPVVLDIATSVASNGLIRTLEMAGKPLPEGWVIDRKDGSAITDTKKISDGVYMPIGGYKGFGLSLMIGVLGGILNGAAFGREHSPFFARDEGRKSNTGQFVIALDVGRFVPLDMFKAEVDRHMQTLRGSARLPGVEEIRIPGDGRAARKADREQNGVALPAALMKRLDELAATLSIKPLAAR